MAEYIEREAVLNYLQEIRGGFCLQTDFRKAVEAVCLSPAADVVEVVHGRWLKQDDYSCCSCCGQAVADACCPWFKFCPNCGARMDGE